MRAPAGDFEPKLHRDNDSYDGQKYSKPIFGAELICRVSLTARGGLRARDGKKAGLQEKPQLIHSITNGLARAT